MFAPGSPFDPYYNPYGDQPLQPPRCNPNAGDIGNVTDSPGGLSNRSDDSHAIRKRAVGDHVNKLQGDNDWLLNNQDIPHPDHIAAVISANPFSHGELISLYSPNDYGNNLKLSSHNGRDFDLQTGFAHHSIVKRQVLYNDTNETPSYEIVSDDGDADTATQSAGQIDQSNSNDDTHAQTAGNVDQSTTRCQPEEEVERTWFSYTSIMLFLIGIVCSRVGKLM